MKRHAKAPSTITAASGEAVHARRTILGIACLCVLGLVAFLGSGAPAVGAAEPLPGQGFLPNDRVWEMVSPADKNGGNVDDRTSRVAPSGNAVAFGSPVGFPGSSGVGSPSNYFSRRTDAGWITEALLPRFNNPGQANALGLVRSVSADATRALISVPESTTVPGWVPPLDPTAPTGCPGSFVLGSFCNNLYLRDTDGSYTLLHDLPLGGVPGGAANAGGTPDYGQFLFEATGAHAPGAPDDELEKLYEWDHGVVRYVGIAPDGQPFPFGTSTTAGLTESNTGASRVRSHPMSEDGRRIYFTVNEGFAGVGAGPIYLREDAAQTFHVTASEKTVPDPPQAAQFLWASPDGGLALFLSSEDLVDSDTQPGQDLYLYRHSDDPSADSNLTLVSRDLEPDDGTEANVDPNFQNGASGGLVGVSADGSSVYFASAGQLVDGADPSAERKLYLWRDGEGGPSLTYIAGLTAADGDNWQLHAFTGSSSPPIMPPRLAVEQVTPTGDELIFLTAQALRADQDDDLDRDVYRYDAGEDELLCISCQPLGEASAGDASFRGPTIGLFVAPARNISDDGSRVFFESVDPLLNHDANGRLDVYQWEAGQLSLLSSGQSPSPSRFLGATASGDDVFIITRERLSGWDVDDSVDLYDARVPRSGESPLPEPPPGEADCGFDCQGLPASRPLLADSGTASFQGSGNVKKGTRPGTRMRRLSSSDRSSLAQGGKARLRVKVAGLGTVAVVGTAKLQGKKRRVISSSAKARKAGSLSIPIRLSKPALGELRRAGSLTVVLTLRFRGRPVRARSGSPQRLTLRLKAPQKHPRKRSTSKGR